MPAGKSEPSGCLSLPTGVLVVHQTGATSPVDPLPSPDSWAGGASGTVVLVD